MTGAETAPIRIVLVDDEDLVRSGLRRILRRKDGFLIVDGCADCPEVPAAITAHLPDIVVMDLRMKRVDGIEATRRFAGPTCGAAGFVLKDSSAEELIRAVLAVPSTCPSGVWRSNAHRPHLHQAESARPGGCDCLRLRLRLRLRPRHRRTPLNEPRSYLPEIWVAMSVSIGR